MKKFYKQLLWLALAVVVLYPYAYVWLNFGPKSTWDLLAYPVMLLSALSFAVVMPLWIKAQSTCDRLNKEFNEYYRKVQVENTRHEANRVREERDYAELNCRLEAALSELRDIRKE